ncbi:NRDE family protein [Flavobacterium sp. ARAG 55.4]|uniref:NRDE family protein n=1 Tax=Flavobacterium sp. ARAG 55.4 TaxID=3451357 RepID=UPI003F46D269
MCTVSFVNSNGRIFITSNRDEKIIRPSAIPPRNYTVNGKNVIFPKDPKAGGTWYIVDETGTVLVLLNGAEEKHKQKSFYRKSRGLIVLELISENSPKDFWELINLENIEPFTLVLFQNNQLFQLRWNGTEKEKLVLDSTEKHIWSSSTLYSSQIRKERADLFYAFLENKGLLSESDMYQFHRYADEENTENGLVINRNGETKTLSITQSIIEKNKVAIVHYDLLTNEDFTTSFIIV